jgi:four helix bundle protein
MKENAIQEKSFQFSLDMIELYKRLREVNETVISKQALRSGTSIGANIEEALAGQSRKDFVAKMAIASKEARETRYWLRLLQQSRLIKTDLAPHLSQVDELIRMLTSIVKTAQQRP